MFLLLNRLCAALSPRKPCIADDNSVMRYCEGDAWRCRHHNGQACLPRIAVEGWGEYLIAVRCLKEIDNPPLPCEWVEGRIEYLVDDNL